MSVELRMVLHAPSRTHSEILVDTAAAGRAVAGIAAELSAEVVPYLVVGKSTAGHLLRGQNSPTPTRITEVVAEYTIEEI